jgi:hypothetical protein
MCNFVRQASRPRPKRGLRTGSGGTGEGSGAGWTGGGTYASMPPEGGWDRKNSGRSELHTGHRAAPDVCVTDQWSARPLLPAILVAAAQLFSPFSCVRRRSSTHGLSGASPLWSEVARWKSVLHWRHPIVPRSLHRPVAVTEGSLTENPNKTGVRFWTEDAGNTCFASAHAEPLLRRKVSSTPRTRATGLDTPNPRGSSTGLPQPPKAS